MIRNWIAMGFFVIGNCYASAQCLPDFSIQTTACANENLIVENTTLDQSQKFSWDFCTGDFNVTPSGSYLTTSYGLPFKLEVVEVNNSFYGFFFSRSARKLYRMDFGSSLSSSPTYHDLGNLGLNSNTLLTIEIIKEGTLFYGLIIEFGTSKLYRLNFGSSIENLPQSVNDLGTFGLISQPIDLVIESDESNLTAFITNYANGRLVRLDFNSSITNTPSGTSLVVPGSSQLGGFAIVRECDTWFGLLSSQGNNKVFKFSFGSSLQNNSPAVNELTLSAPILNPAGIAFVREADNFYGFVQSFNSSGSLSRISFSSLSNNFVTVNNYGNLGVISFNWALSVYEHQSEWYGFSASNSSSSLNGLSSNLNRFKFSNSCGATISWYEGINPPPVQYSQAGTYSISLTSTANNGNVKALARTISVSSLQAPQFSIVTDDTRCINATKTFEIVPASSIISASWNFEDGNFDNTINTSNTYLNSGEFNVSASVVDANGCSNNNSVSIEIFNPPIASFTPPMENPLCTNQSYQFTNTSQFDPNADPLWEWFVNGTSVSEEEDLTYLFDSDESKTILLRATIPGCVGENSALVDNLLVGPLVDFTFIGNCQLNDISFASDIQGSVQDVFWDFGDVETSLDSNPSHKFVNIGVFNVALRANSPNGCQNTKTKPVTIYSLPQPNFQLELPPFSCGGMPSQFTDLSPSPVDSNITGWSWSFGDDGSDTNTSTLKNPTHVYDNAGQYDVTLTAETNYGCMDSIAKTVTIAQTPAVEILNTPACDDVPTTFSASSSSELQSWNWQIGITQFSIPEPTYLFTNPGSYTVSLDALGANNCIASMSKNVIVPQSLIPDFAVNKNCVGQSTEFDDVTVLYDDPISTYSWSFGDAESGSGSPVLHSYQNTGNYNVNLNLITASGCTYSRVKSIAVGNPPQASFTASPDVGVPPLNVNFINTSSGASQYLWNFNENNTTSTETSPQFTFLDYGNYVVDLTAYNGQNCSHTVSKVVTAALPFIDVGLENLVVSENADDLLTGRVVIHNKGNITIQNLNLAIDLSGIRIQQIVAEPIPPYSSILYTLNFNLVKGNQLEYICIEADLTGDNNEEDNSLCTSFEAETVVIAPYPNPTSGSLYVDWISPDEHIAQISIHDPLGKLVFENQIESAPGLNSVLLNLERLTQGAYVMSFNAGYTKKVFRFVVNR